MNALKSFPFCGGAAGIKSRENGKLPTEWHVACFNDCEVSPSVWRGSEAEAIAAWNCRADGGANIVMKHTHIAGTGS